MSLCSHESMAAMTACIRGLPNSLGRALLEHKSLTQHHGRMLLMASHFVNFQLVCLEHAFACLLRVGCAGNEFNQNG